MATVQNPSDKRRQSVAVTTDKTLSLADCGIVQDVQADGKVITLPATSAGASFTFRNAGVPVTNGPLGLVRTRLSLLLSARKPGIKSKVTD